MNSDAAAPFIPKIVSCFLLSLFAINSGLSLISKSTVLEATGDESIDSWTSAHLVVTPVILGPFDSIRNHKGKNRNPMTLDEEAFRLYGRQTAELWVLQYGKFYMPVSLHQLFIHGWESLRQSSLPITFFTEQSLESCNKAFKSDRLHHSRRDSRLNTMTDQFNRQTDRTSSWSTASTLSINALKSQRR